VRERVIIICATVVLVTAIGAGTLLELYGKDPQLRGLLLLVGPPLSGLATSFVALSAGKRAEHKVDAAKDEITTTVANGMSHPDDKP
jgi:hypothetical protein